MTTDHSPSLPRDDLGTAWERETLGGMKSEERTTHGWIWSISKVMFIRRKIEVSSRTFLLMKFESWGNVVFN